MEGEGSGQQGAHDAQHGEFREGRCQEGGFREKQVLGDMEGQGQGKHQLLGQEAGRHPQGSDGVKDEYQQIQEGTQDGMPSVGKALGLDDEEQHPQEHGQHGDQISAFFQGAVAKHPIGQQGHEQLGDQGKPIGIGPAGDEMAQAKGGGKQHQAAGQVAEPIFLEGNSVAHSRSPWMIP